MRMRPRNRHARQYGLSRPAAPDVHVLAGSRLGARRSGRALDFGPSLGLSKSLASVVVNPGLGNTFRQEVPNVADMSDRPVVVQGGGGTAGIAIVAVIAIALIVAVLLWHPWATTSNTTIVQPPAQSQGAAGSSNGSTGSNGSTSGNSGSSNSGSTSGSYGSTSGSGSGSGSSGHTP